MDSNSATIIVIDLGVSDSSISSNKCSLFLILFHSFLLYTSPFLPVLLQISLLIFFMAQFYFSLASIVLIILNFLKPGSNISLVVSRNFLETVLSSYLNTKNLQSGHCSFYLSWMCLPVYQSSAFHDVALVNYSFVIHQKYVFELREMPSPLYINEITVKIACWKFMWNSEYRQTACYSWGNENGRNSCLFIVRGK